NPPPTQRSAETFLRSYGGSPGRVQSADVALRRPTMIKVATRCAAICCEAWTTRRLLSGDKQPRVPATGYVNRFIRGATTTAVAYRPPSLLWDRNTGPSPGGRP